LTRAHDVATPPGLSLGAMDDGLFDLDLEAIDALNAAHPTR
jgi:hypothetical protein